MGLLSKLNSLIILVWIGLSAVQLGLSMATGSIGTTAGIVGLFFAGLIIIQSLTVLGRQE